MYGYIKLLTPYMGTNPASYKDPDQYLSNPDEYVTYAQETSKYIAIIIYAMDKSIMNYLDKNMFKDV